MLKKKEIKLLNSDKKIPVFYFWNEIISPQGEAILVLPGLDESILDYKNFLKSLSEKMPTYSILAIDLRGQGETLNYENKFHPITISLEEQNYIINQIMNDLPIKKVFILGLSYGAGIGLYFANRTPMTQGLFMLAPYVSKFKIFQPGIVGFWYELVHLNPFYKIISHFTLPFYFKAAKHRGRLNPLTRWEYKNLSALTKLTTGIMQLSTTKEIKKLKELNFGLNIIVGEKDDLVSIKAIEHLMKQTKISNKTLTILPNSGHRLLINNSDDCALWVQKIVNDTKAKFLNL